jgi:outer membrane lipoprotein carrier protein
VGSGTFNNEAIVSFRSQGHHRFWALSLAFGLLSSSAHAQTPSPAPASPATPSPAAKANPESERAEPPSQAPARSSAPSPASPGAAGASPVTKPSSAGPAASPDAVAAAVQSFYDQTKSVESEFHQTYYNRLYDKYDRSNGKVKFEKPGKMRWDYAAPNGKVIVSDGKKLTIYEPGEEGEPGQLFERAIAESELPQALAFLTGTGKLANDFTFRLLDAAAQGFANGHVLELMPKTPSPHFERILFYVDADAKRVGLVHRVLIVDAAGNRNRIDFKAPRFNRPLDAKTFAWQPPKNVRRIQP